MLNNRLVLTVCLLTFTLQNQAYTPTVKQIAFASGGTAAVTGVSTIVLLHLIKKAEKAQRLQPTSARAKHINALKSAARVLSMATAGAGALTVGAAGVYGLNRWHQLKRNPQRKSLMESGNAEDILVAEQSLSNGAAIPSSSEGDGLDCESTSLVQAAAKGDLARVKALLTGGGAILQQEKEEALCEAVRVLDEREQEGILSIALELLRSGAYRDKDNRLDLMSATMGGDLKPLRELKAAYKPKQRAAAPALQDPKANSTVGAVAAPQTPEEIRTAEFVASLKKNVVDLKHIQQLVDDGANVNVLVQEHVGDKFLPALSCVARNCNKPLELFTMMLRAPGIDIQATDDSGSTVLHWVCSRASLETTNAKLEQLIAKGANVNAQDNEGYTPLMWAVWHRKLEAVKMLLAVPGINSSLKNKRGQTAKTFLDYRRAGALRTSLEGDQIDTEITDLLEQHARTYPWQKIWAALPSVYALLPSAGCCRRKKQAQLR